METHGQLLFLKPSSCLPFSLSLYLSISLLSYPPSTPHYPFSLPRSSNLSCPLPIPHFPSHTFPSDHLQEIILPFLSPTLLPLSHSSSPSPHLSQRYHSPPPSLSQRSFTRNNSDNQSGVNTVALRKYERTGGGYFYTSFGSEGGDMIRDRLRARVPL